MSHSHSSQDDGDSGLDSVEGSGRLTMIDNGIDTPISMVPY